MKYLKTLGLAAVAATALTAFMGAGTASANTVVCETTLTTGCAASGWDWNVGAKFNGSLKTGDTIRLTDTSGFITLSTCTGSTVEGEQERTTTPRGVVSTGNVTWSGCSSTVDMITGGVVEVHHISGTHNGTMTVTGFALTTKNGSNTCTYGFPTATDVGTLTTSANGLQAQLAISVVASLIPAHSSVSGCGADGRMAGTYVQTNSTPVYISES